MDAVVSVMMPVYNEAATVETILGHVLVVSAAKTRAGHSLDGRQRCVHADHGLAYRRRLVRGLTANPSVRRLRGDLPQARSASSWLHNPIKARPPMR